MLTAMQDMPAQQSLVDEGEVLGQITTVTGQVIPIVTAGGADTVLLPGEHATITLDLDTAELQRGTDVAGRYLVATPSGEISVPVVATAEVIEPDLWWRLTNPGKVFGWG